MGRTVQTARVLPIKQGAKKKMMMAKKAVAPAAPVVRLSAKEKKAQEKAAKEASALAKMDPIALKAQLEKEFATRMEKLELEMKQKMSTMQSGLESEYRMKLKESEFSFAHQFQTLSNHLRTPTPSLSAASTPSHSVSPVSFSLTADSENTSSAAAASSSSSSSSSTPFSFSSPAFTPSPASSSSVSLPSPSHSRTEASEWSKIDYRTIPFPSDWPIVDESAPVTLETLEPDSADFLRLEKMMRDGGLPQSKLLVVQRIYNRPLWARYYLARQRVMQKHGNEHLNNAESMGNEKLLFHGTRNTPPHMIYATADGFDVRMAGYGMLGNGCYFSTSSQYSGQSYAHHIGGGGNNSYNGYPSVNPLIPPLLTLSTATTPKKNNSKKKVASTSTKSFVPQVVADKLPANAAQMIVARVVCGTEFNHKKQQYNSERRPPPRPFKCDCCNKTIQLETMHLEIIKQEFLEQEERKLKKNQPQLEIVEEEESKEEEVEEEEEKESEKKPSSTRKRKSVSYGSSRKKKAKAAATPAVAAAASASTSSSTPAASSSSSAPSTPLKLKPWIAAALAQISSPQQQVASTVTEVAPFQPTPAVTAAIAAATNSFSTFLASFPKLNAIDETMQVAAPQAEVAAAPASVTAVASASASAPASVDEEMKVDTVAAEPVAAAAAASSSSSSNSSIPSGQRMVHCPHCSVELGTRDAILAHPYRYDSINMDHMSVVYESDRAFPEFLLTFQPQPI